MTFDPEFHAAPEDALRAIARCESERLALTFQEALEQIQSARSFYVDRYLTDSPGYVGPVCLILWPADPGAVSTYIRRHGRWDHCNSTSW